MTVATYSYRYKQEPQYTQSPGTVCSTVCHHKHNIRSYTPWILYISTEVPTHPVQLSIYRNQESRATDY